MQISRIKAEITKSLSKINPNKIILFGSYAWGNPTRDSDLDLLVVTNDEMIPANFDERMKVYIRVANALNRLRDEIPIDLIVHTKPMHEKFVKLDSMFARKIIREGIVL